MNLFRNFTQKIDKAKLIDIGLIILIVVLVVVYKVNKI